ncbi:isochorismatase family protein [Puniceibacterium sp. IMCC21224]|uniref:isochorismatase family protein n=1 Tax=Puniceibacterium sp. IMCC21224 TaxID=1618204 RepID=UPI00065D17C4|nr:isochorismatase family protein [Puniceibacterium sp. IMCC21224]KMK64885.1 nicotinamidase-like amidase [Puniceibacterium sp. IMCC21224]
MSGKLEKWQGFVPDEDLATYRKGGFGERIGFGERVALLNIDTTWMFVDPSYDMCGRELPQLKTAIIDLTTQFRQFGLPIYYSRRDNRNHPVRRGIWNLKLSVAESHGYTVDPRADEWPDEYAPTAADVVIEKNKPSCFFETPLESFLRYDRVDTLVVVGISTSGCVRAAVTDAFSHNFRVIVVEEAVGDRSASAHQANLFDMDMKFADVESHAYVTAELDRLYGTRQVAE